MNETEQKTRKRQVSNIGLLYVNITLGLGIGSMFVMAREFYLTGGYDLIWMLPAVVGIGLSSLFIYASIPDI